MAHYTIAGDDNVPAPPRWTMQLVDSWRGHALQIVGGHRPLLSHFNIAYCVTSQNNRYHTGPVFLSHSNEYKRAWKRHILYLQSSTVCGCHGVFLYLLCYQLILL